jgi:hypothetical protein
MQNIDKVKVGVKLLQDATIGFLLPASYLAFVIFFKKLWLDKKYDKKKSSIITDCLNGMLIFYFLAIGNWLLAVMFAMIGVSQYNYHKPKVKK